MVWPRPIPVIGDTTSSADRAFDPRGWAMPAADIEAFYRVVSARRDVRRFRPDPVSPEILERVLGAAHAAPSVGHSQPWRFVLVRDPVARWEAALAADRERLRQAAAMDDLSGRQLLDLDLEGIREAPLGVVVCCDRRTPAAGVLGRATFVDSDIWSCVCAIENLWLAARAEGLGVGWVTLFRPEELRRLVDAPEGVLPLGWFCVGWPDERPPAPGLERRGWSERLPLADVVIEGRWPSAGPPPPVSHLRREPLLPAPADVVAARDRADVVLAAPGSLGVLDRAVDRLVALGFGGGADAGGTLVIAAADHPVASHGVSAYPTSVTRNVAEASLAGVSIGAVAARSSGLGVVVVDAGVDGGPLDNAAAVCQGLSIRPVGPRGDLVDSDAMTKEDTRRLVDAGVELGRSLGAAVGGRPKAVMLGEVGVGNTTVAAALTACLLDAQPSEVVGLGSGADSSMVTAKRSLVAAAVARLRSA
ncbi:MAG: 5,6-dimethylbenzimidazole synthase, partial [Acidimicrobiales bacterium]